MPGLIQQGASPQQPVPQMGGADPSSQGRQGIAATPEQAGDEDQQAYDHFVANCLDVISTKEVMATIIKMFKEDDDLIDALARVAVMITVRVEDDGEQNGIKLDPDILLQGGGEVVAALAEVARRANIHDFTEEEMNAAMMKAVDMYRLTRQQQGKINTQSAQQDLAALKQADQSGTLDQQFPGMSEAAKSLPAPPAPDDGQSGDAAPGRNKSRRKARRRREKAKKRKGSTNG